MKKKLKTSILGRFIQQKRKSRGITQQELARHAMVSFTLVNRIENGDMKLNISSVNKVLHVFGYVLGPVYLDTENEGYQERKQR